MKINQKIIIVFSITIIILVEVVGFISFQSLESAVIDSGVNDMKTNIASRVDQINHLHLEASKEMTLAVHQFELFPSLQAAGSMNMNMGNDNSSSMRTESVSSDSSDWIKYYQALFDVPAKCYLHPKDASMYQKIVSEEQSALPTGYGNVYIQPPYVSPHIGAPVIAYVAKIKQNDVDSSIFHCEIPFTIFNDIVKTTSGNINIVDSTGKTIVNSYSNTTSKDTATNLSILNIINTSKDGFGTYVMNEETNYVVFKKLPTFGWSIVYEKPYSSFLSGNTSLSQLELKIFVVAVIVGVAGFVVVFLISSKIYRPITQLANACRAEDVSNLKKIEILKSQDEVADVANAVNEMISKVNMLEKQREEFASMITHELKTPLQPIIGWCGNLKNSKIMGVASTERQITAINAIERNAKRLEQLIGDVMDVHKLDLHKMKFDHSDINVTEFMSLMHSNFQEIMKPKRIRFTNSAIDGNMVITADKNRLEQVLTNLILNAVDFVSVDGMIEIGAKDNGDGSILFYVKDNGKGIKKEMQKDLFKKFYQVDASLTRTHGGTGLGLAISKAIVEAFGGKIWFKSEEGNGSSFYFTITRSMVR
ncbi:MAG: HAMP domain-containing protein [Thaumarchaeota archaeon]|nr:MAG: HAMP domain-containing protein [Nitrososphaerota archaeon]